MDPNANLARQRELCKAIIISKNDGDAAYYGEELVNLVRALDKWICQGGFLPSDWELNRRSG